MIFTALLGHFARVELPEGVLEVGEGSFGLTDLGIVPTKDIGVGRRLTNELGGLEKLALRLDALVDILDLLVQLARLRGDEQRDDGGDMAAHHVERSPQMRGRCTTRSWPWRSTMEGNKRECKRR